MTFLGKTQNMKVVYLWVSNIPSKFQLVWNRRTPVMAFLVETVQICIHYIMWFIACWKRIILRKCSTRKLLRIEWTRFCKNFMTFGLIVWELDLCKVAILKLSLYGKLSFKDWNYDLLCDTILRRLWSDSEKVSFLEVVPF